MLTPPDISTDTILEFVRDEYALRPRTAEFLPVGADVNSFAYRVEAGDDAVYFLKLRRGEFAEIVVAVPAFLHAHGIPEVMAPLPSVAGRLWESAHGFTWLLYPYFDGGNGYQTPLTEAHWIALGRSMRAWHDTILPPELERLVPREVYSPVWREVVKDFARDVELDRFKDPVARSLAAFWREKRDEIGMIVHRTERLADEMRGNQDAYVLCHTDLHPANVLVGANGALAVVDWDAPLFAPKERDLICLDGGVSPTWNDPREDALFFQGYGPAEINRAALAYYRYTRIVDDLASYGEQIFLARGSLEDREWGLEKMTGQFLPGQVVDIAHRTYQQID